MLRKLYCLIGVACVMMVMTLPVSASEGSGSIRVIPVWGGKQVDEGEISVSRVGDRVGSGFRITDGLADWTVSEQEILSGQWTQWLQNDKQDFMSREGTAVFEGLEEGLYLVQQRRAAAGFLPFAAFLLSVPEGGNQDVIREVKLIRDTESPATGDRHIPLIGAMGLGLSVAVLMVLVDQHKK